MLSRPPARKALFDKVIEGTQRPSADPTKVVPRPTDIRVVVRDHARQTPTRPPRLLPQLIPDASQRLGTDVEKHPAVAPLMGVAEEYERLAPGIKDARLLRVQRQTEPSQHACEPGQFAVRTPRREEDQIVRVANEPASQRAVVHVRAEVPIHQV